MRASWWSEREEWKSLLKAQHSKDKDHGIWSLKAQHWKTKIMASGPITSWQIDGETMADLFSWAPKSWQMVTAPTKLKDTSSLEEKLWPT